VRNAAAAWVSVRFASVVAALLLVIG